MKKQQKNKGITMKIKNVLIGSLFSLMLLFTIQGATADSTGGIITYDGNYTIHTFTSNGSFNGSVNLNVTVLIVASGGAGGGDYDGGGGGGGGIIYNTSYNATGSINVTVGSEAINSNGYDSTFGTLTAIGGGIGGTGLYGTSYGDNGGSGGGGCTNAANLHGTGGNATIWQGNDGGDASPVDYWTAGGGGGGAGTAGVTGSGIDGSEGYGVGGDGGNGTCYSINGSDVCYGGGGGAGTWTQTGAINGKGGLGGGGNGSLNGAGDAGIPNTGGGGGGRGNNAGIGGNGGSGIVIVRYLTYAGCNENWVCSLYGTCNASSIIPCLAVNDSNSCNTTFNGSLSTYDESCTYVYLSPMNESSEGNMSEWKMFGRYLNHTAWDGANYSTIPGLNQASYATGGKITSSPAVAFGFVYFASKDGMAYQVNASNVSQLIANFTVSTVNPDGTRSSFAVVNISGNLYAYIGGGDGIVYQLDALNISHMIASYDTNQTFITASPAIGYVDGHYYLYIGDDRYYSDGLGGTMWQLDAENISNLIASYRTSGSIYDTPAVTSKYVYFGSLNHDFYQNNASNINQSLATYTTLATVKSSPAVMGGYVYIASYDGYIYQFNATNISQVIHSYYEGNEIFSSIVISGDYAYIGTKWTDEILQLNASNISQLIHSYSTGTGTGNFIHSSPTIADGYVYFAADNGIIYQLNASDVSQLITIFNTSFGYEYATISSPAVANGYVYIGMPDGKLYQLNATNISLENAPECVNDSDCGFCMKCSAGACVNQTAFEDLKNECSASYDSCLNAYTRQGSSGYCDGLGTCGVNDTQANVTIGNVCYNGNDTDPNATINCGIWSDCVQNATSANEYYIGYLGDGTNTCNDTDWQSTGTIWNATAGYWINVTEHADTCQQNASGCINDSECGFCQKCSAGTCVNENVSEDLKNECSISINCSNAYTIASQSGFCNGFGVCQAVNNTVIPGHVCVAGVELTASASTHCGVWSDCVLHAYSANEYYVGYNPNGSCNDTDWQAAGSTQSAPTNFWWSISGHMDTCTSIRVYSFASGPGGPPPTQLLVENVSVIVSTLKNLVFFPEILNIVRQSGTILVLDNKGDNDVVIVRAYLNDSVGPTDLTMRLSLNKYSFTVPAHGTATILLKSNAIQRVQGSAKLVLRDASGNQIIVPVSADLTIPGIMGDAIQGIIQFLGELFSRLGGLRA